MILNDSNKEKGKDEKGSKNSLFEGDFNLYVGDDYKGKIVSFYFKEECFKVYVVFKIW